MQWLPLDYAPPRKWKDVGRFRVREDYRFQGVTLPKGFISDGATVPRLFWWLFPPTGEYLMAAILHDYLLTHVDRDTADLKFLSALRALKVSEWRAKLMYAGVRARSKYVLYTKAFRS